jgi:hypothetical protein
MAMQGGIQRSYEVSQEYERIIEDTDDGKCISGHNTFYFICHLLDATADFCLRLQDTDVLFFHIKAWFSFARSVPGSRIKNAHLNVNM